MAKKHKHNPNTVTPEQRQRQQEFLRAMGLVANNLGPRKRTPEELARRQLRENRDRDQRRRQLAVVSARAQAEASWTRTFAQKGRKSSRTCSSTRAMVAREREQRLQEGNEQAQQAWALEYTNKDGAR